MRLLHSFSSTQLRQNYSQPGETANETYCLSKNRNPSLKSSACASVESKENGNVAISNFGKDITALQCLLIFSKPLLALLKDSLYFSIIRTFIC